MFKKKNEVSKFFVADLQNDKRFIMWKSCDRYVRAAASWFGGQDLIETW